MDTFTVTMQEKINKIKINEFTHLCDKDPKKQQCDVPSEEEEGRIDPEVVEEGEVNKSRNAVKRMDRAGGGRRHLHNNLYPIPLKALKAQQNIQNLFLKRLPVQMKIQSFADPCFRNVT